MATAPRELDRPAFYALSSGGWRDLVTILHPPYTLWHLSYVAIGAAAATTLHADRLIAALGAFFLAVGISAHALDELRRRTTSVHGQQELDDGQVLELSKQRLAEPLEGALSAMWLALVLMAIGLVAVRV